MLVFESGKGADTGQHNDVKGLIAIALRKNEFRLPESSMRNCQPVNLLSPLAKSGVGMSLPYHCTAYSPMSAKNRLLLFELLYPGRPRHPARFPDLASS